MSHSKQIGTYEAGKYFVTAASWDSCGFGPSFEIGIRTKTTGDFILLQSEKWNHQTVQEVANAIAHLIGMPDISGEHYTPEWCRRHFT